MKHPHGYPYLLFLLLLPILHACNGDVFVDEVKLPLTEATLSGDGDTLVLRFNTPEWLLVNAYEGNDVYGLSGHLYTLDGTDMGIIPSCYLKDKGKIVVTGLSRELIFTRSNDRELQVCIGENITGRPFHFSILIGNKEHYGREQEIFLTQDSGSGYVIDRIEYSLIPESVNTETAEELYLSHYKYTDKPEVRTYNLNEHMYRHVLLSCPTEINFAQTDDNPPTIELPSADISQGVKPSNDRIKYFQYGNDLVEMSVQPPFMYTVTLQQGITNIKRTVERQVYSANYTLFLRNAGTGKPYTVQGILCSKTPTGTIGSKLEHQKNDK
ncbi:hypothetical protein [uncultured Bacteroides sp.]|uniref:hypothetical protein n=1 Tax=uncultured Bacteroides sp. TaxID=162156 RepID=UPI0025F7A920|nr:hypothetical protein [uncultured Bacteroides sp.]